MVDVHTDTLVLSDHWLITGRSLTPPPWSSLSLSLRISFFSVRYFCEDGLIVQRLQIVATSFALAHLSLEIHVHTKYESTLHDSVAIEQTHGVSSVYFPDYMITTLP